MPRQAPVDNPLLRDLEEWYQSMHGRGRQQAAAPAPAQPSPMPTLGGGAYGGEPARAAYGGGFVPPQAGGYMDAPDSSRQPGLQDPATALMLARQQATMSAAPGVEDDTGAQLHREEVRHQAAQVAEQQAQQAAYARQAGDLSGTGVDELLAIIDALPTRQGAGGIREAGNPQYAQALHDRLTALGVNGGHDDRGGVHFALPSAPAASAAPAPLPAGMGGGSKNATLEIQRIATLLDKEAVPADVRARLGQYLARLQLPGEQGVAEHGAPGYAQGLSGMLDDWQGAIGGRGAQNNQKAQALYARLRKTFREGNAYVKGHGRDPTQAELYRAWAHLHGIKGGTR